jgi:hypothetical protein
MSLSLLELPRSLNYAGVFLTLGCNLGCAYCINDPAQAGARKELFPLGALEMSPERWVEGLSRLPVSDDLPITLQGGEPTLYWRGRGIAELLRGLDHKFDLLTNLTLNPAKFAGKIADQHEKLRRAAPYPSIRVSYHQDEMERLWNGNGFETLLANCEGLGEIGFTVSPDKAESDVGIYMVAHPDNRLTEEMTAAAAGRVPFETKEFLGVHDGISHGTYLYPFSTDLIARDLHAATLACECRTSELLIDPLGFVWGCHFHLYDCWSRGGLPTTFKQLEASDFDFSTLTARDFVGQAHRPTGHILDPDFSLGVLNVFRPCADYGRCIGCDTKVKNNRFQSLDDHASPHTSVEIRNIDMPEQVLARMNDDERARIAPHLHRTAAA